MWVSLANTTRILRRSFFFLTQQTFPPPPTPRSLVQREQLNCIAQKLYIGLGNIKGGRKTDSDEHYIATSAKCIVRRIREIIREATKASFLFPLITSSARRLLVYTGRAHFALFVQRRGFWQSPWIMWLGRFKMFILVILLPKKKNKKKKPKKERKTKQKKKHIEIVKCVTTD